VPGQAANDFDIGPTGELHLALSHLA
jgi:hypothetical protein